MAPQNQTNIMPSQVDSSLVDLNNYICEEIQPGHSFVIKHRDDATRTVFEITMVDSGDKITFDGLPEVMKKHLIAFSKEELRDYPSTCLNVILKQTYQPKEALKSADEANLLIKNAADIKLDNPSKYYKVVGKEGVGGFARVFRC